jgi:hypothetical protein
MLQHCTAVPTPNLSTNLENTAPAQSDPANCSPDSSTRPGSGHCSAHCPLLTAHCSLLTAHCSLLTAHCSLLTAHSEHPNIKWHRTAAAVLAHPEGYVGGGRASSCWCRLFPVVSGRQEDLLWAGF